jgi:hypothetical protein
MAETIARTMELNPDETAAVGASVKDFKAELTDFLRWVDYRIALKPSV